MSRVGRDRPLAACLVMLCAMLCACAVSSPVATSRSAATPARSRARVTLYPLPPGVPTPHQLTIGPDGTPWLTAFDGRQVPGVLDGGSVHDAILYLTAGGAFAVFPLPSSDSYPDGLTAGPDGNIWFAEFYGDAIGRITPQGTITEFLVPPRSSRITGALPQSQPHAIVTGPDGNLWFPDAGGNKIGRLTPAGVLREFPIPPHAENPIGSFPYGIAAGPDGNLWFTEETSMRIGRITPLGQITEFKLPGVNHVPGDIVAGGGGTLWFLEPDKGLLGRISTGGRIVEFPVPHAACHLDGIEGSSSGGVCETVYLAAGASQSVWLSEPWRGELGRFDAQDHFSEFPLPASASQGLGALAVGPDGAVWFIYGGGIGRFSP